MRKLNYFFNGLLVGLIVIKNFINIIQRFIVSAYKTISYVALNIHYRTLGVTETSRCCKRLGVFFFGVAVYLTQANVEILAQSVPKVNLSLIAQIESSGNPSAVNKADHGGKGSRGLYQISEGLRTDYNRLNKASISPAELFNPEVNTQVASWAFQVYYPLLLTKVMKRPVTVRNLIICHNAGCGKVNNPPAHTLNVYLPKYQRLGGKL